jgi:cysteine dioxygenase
MYTEGFERSTSMAMQSEVDGCTSAADRFPKLGALIAYLDSLKGRADLGTLTKLLNGVEVSRCDIAPCCVFGTRGYKRNTITESPWYELLALCWHSGDVTPIHDHQGVSCAFRVIEGTGTEIRFKPTASGLICPAATIEMNPGYVCAADDADIHQVANMQAPGTDLITLHIYSPPIKKMNTYDFAYSIGRDVAERYAVQAAGDQPC